MLSSNMVLRWHVIWIWFDVLNAIFVKLVCCVIFNSVYMNCQLKLCQFSTIHVFKMSTIRSNTGVKHTIIIRNRGKNVWAKLSICPKFNTVRGT